MTRPTPASSQRVRETPQQTLDYRRVERALRYLAEHHAKRPALAEVAAEVGLSEHHFQRLFQRWAGVSPKRFAQFLTREHALTLLARHSVLATSQALGLGSSARLHDLLVSSAGITPGDVRSQGKSLRIAWGVHDTPFGPCFVAAAPRGVCQLAFVEEARGEEPRAELEKLRERFAAAELSFQPQVTKPLCEQTFAGARGRALPVWLRGTPFQLQVWEALWRIPSGQLRSYAQVAAAVGRANAVRAVASAIAQNQIAYLIPCHRVIRSIGGVGEYRWGAARKQAMVGWESARVEAGEG